MRFTGVNRPTIGLRIRRTRGNNTGHRKVDLASVIAFVSPKPRGKRTGRRLFATSRDLAEPVSKRIRNFAKWNVACRESRSVTRVRTRIDKRALLLITAARAGAIYMTFVHLLHETQSRDVDWRAGLEMKNRVTWTNPRAAASFRVQRFQYISLQEIDLFRFLYRLCNYLFTRNLSLLFLNQALDLVRDVTSRRSLEG